MTGNTVDLQAMLARREKRSLQQQNFLQTYHSTLVSFCMNIPGPIKTNPQIRKAFSLGRNLLLGQLKEAGAQVIAAHEIHEDTGDELLLAVSNIEPQKLKDIAVRIEESSPVGRLYDIDVIDPQGQKLSRPSFRKCLICERQAQECARSRTHSVLEMQNAIDKLLGVTI